MTALEKLAQAYSLIPVRKGEPSHVVMHPAFYQELILQAEMYGLINYNRATIILSQELPQREVLFCFPPPTSSNAEERWVNLYYKEYPENGPWSVLKEVEGYVVNTREAANSLHESLQSHSPKRRVGDGPIKVIQKP